MAGRPRGCSTEQQRTVRAIPSAFLGTKGSLCSDGLDLDQQIVALSTATDRATARLRGIGFSGGFRGAMGALLVAIEDDAEPAKGAAVNLRSLALAFTAIRSRRFGREVAVGQATGRTFDPPALTHGRAGMSLAGLTGAGNGRM